MELDHIATMLSPMVFHTSAEGVFHQGEINRGFATVDSHAGGRERTDKHVQPCRYPADRGAGRPQARAGGDRCRASTASERVGTVSTSVSRSVSRVGRSSVDQGRRQDRGRLRQERPASSSRLLNNELSDAVRRAERELAARQESAADCRRIPRSFASDSQHEFTAESFHILSGAVSHLCQQEREQMFSC